MQQTNTYPIAVYNEFRAQLTELKEANEKIVFDYDTPAGEKEARSHIYKLRQTKSAVDKARKAEKESSLEYGRRVDAEAKEIVSEIDAMIDVHEAPLLLKKQREERRVAMLQEKISAMKECAESHRNSASQKIEAALSVLNGIVIDETFGEFFDLATRTKAEAIESLTASYNTQLQAEKDKEELERLRKENEERERAEREKKIAEDAAAQATAAAEARAQAERDAAEKRERQLIEDKERAERAAAEAVEKERLRIEKENESIRALVEKRERDLKHIEEVHNAIASDLIKCQFVANEILAHNLITAIREGRIAHVKIIY